MFIERAGREGGVNSRSMGVQVGVEDSALETCS